MRSWCHNESLPCIPASGEASSNFSAASRFGTGEFQALTENKPLTVFSILRLGFDVLLSDIDIFFKQNPFKTLSDFGSTYDILVQSDERYGTPDLVEANCMGLNSGFYLVRFSNRTVAAFEAITTEIKTKRIYGSDQPPFYNVLCGAKGEYIRDNSTCHRPDFSVTTHVLSREQWPNGDQAGVKDHTITASSADPVVIVHFNYIVGRDAKIKHMRTSDMWLLDGGDRCPHVQARL